MPPDYPVTGDTATIASTFQVNLNANLLTANWLNTGTTALIQI